MSQSTGKLGIAAVLLGVVALGLAIIPRAVFEVPPPWSTGPAPEPREVTEGGKSIEWKGTKVTIGGTTKLVYPPPPPPVSAASKSVFICTAVAALAGIAVGLIAARRERSYLLAGPALAMCCMALLWDCVLIGVSYAIGFIVIVLFILALVS